MERKRGKMMADQTTFFTLVRSARERACARLVIDSLRAFGGWLSTSRVWLFEAGEEKEGAGGEGVEIVRLIPPQRLRGYAFADKVCACAQAEKLAGASRQTLVWVNPECLFLRPPEDLVLRQPHDVAVRPVHIRNVGLSATDPLDAYWSRIYELVGAEATAASVESFVDGLTLRPYFNTHVFSFDPSQGIASRWLECFEALACDHGFQREACGDELHQIFLHQAVLSAMLNSRMEQGRIRILPVEYSYPYHLHSRIPPERQARALNDLICVVYEECTLDPDRVQGLPVREPLRSWLASRAGAMAAKG